MSIVTWEFESPPLHKMLLRWRLMNRKIEDCLHAFLKKSLVFHYGNYTSKQYQERIAEIAQLVEHNLAKVGVAGPSPVFRSCFVCDNTTP